MGIAPTSHTSTISSEQSVSTTTKLPSTEPVNKAALDQLYYGKSSIIRSLEDRFPLHGEHLTDALSDIHTACNKNGEPFSIFNILSIGIFGIINGTKSLINAAYEFSSGNPGEANIYFRNGIADLLLGAGLSGSVSAAVWGITNSFALPPPIGLGSAAAVAGGSIATSMFFLIASGVQLCEREQNWVREKFENDPLVEQCAERIALTLLERYFLTHESADKASLLEYVKHAPTENSIKRLLEHELKEIWIDSPSSESYLNLRYRSAALIAVINSKLAIALSKLDSFPDYYEACRYSDELNPHVVKLVVEGLKGC